MIYFFSGTGNSYWAAKQIAAGLGEGLESFVLYREKMLVCNDAVIGFVMPTYMWDAPKFVRGILKRASLGKDSYIFLVMTSNKGRKNFGYTSIDGLVQNAGGRLSAAFMVQMPGNALESSAEENEKRLKEAPARMDEIVKAVQDRTVNYKPKRRALAKSKKDFSLRGASFAILPECDGCGLCAGICPTGNIQIVDGKAVHGSQCASCFACMHWCPKHAARITTGKLGNRSQYTHPDVRVGELMVNQKISASASHKLHAQIHTGWTASETDRG